MIIDKDTLTVSGFYAMNSKFPSFVAYNIVYQVDLAMEIF
jgi:hypothetical protein